MRRIKADTLLAMGLIMAGSIVTSCGTEIDKPAEDSSDSNVDPNLRIGHVMVEVGHRFETAGRAAEAENWGLAGYEVEEILEMFHMDMTRSLLPGVCDDSVSDAMYENLIVQLPELRAAAEAENADDFRSNFVTVSSSCNGCHAGCEVPFIRVPRVPGAEVPIVVPRTSTETDVGDEPEDAVEGDSEPTPAADSEPAAAAEEGERAPE